MYFNKPHGYSFPYFFEDFQTKAATQVRRSKAKEAKGGGGEDVPIPLPLSPGSKGTISHAEIVPILDIQSNPY